jgi:hypothetical protein
MNYAVEMGSGAMIYIPSFMKTGSGIQKLWWKGDSHTHIEQDDLMSLLSFFQNKESRLIILWFYYIRTNDKETSQNSECVELYLHSHMYARRDT